MRRFLLAASMLAIGCSTDTFEGPDGGSDGGDGGSSGGDAVATDASIDVASCAPTWCSIGAQPPGSFCTDFDESSALPDNWIQDAPNGSLNVVASPAEQCQSLHAHLGQVTGTSGAARLNHVATVVSTTSTHATLTLDVMLPQTDGGGLVFYFGIRTGTLSIGLVQRADGTWWPSRRSGRARSRRRSRLKARCAERSGPWSST